MGWTTTVAAYNCRIEAEIVVARLSSVGIPAYVAADNLAGNFPLMQLWEGGCRVCVPTRALHAAKNEIVRIGSNALDPHRHYPARHPTEAQRTARYGYVIGTIVGWALGYGPWPPG